MVYKSVQHGKILVDLFFTITFIFLRKTKNKTTDTEPVLRDMLRHLHGL